MSILIHPQSEELVARLQQEPEVAKLLELLAHHSEEKYQHSVRVAALAVDLGIDVSLRPDESEDLGRAGLLHDIGVLGVPQLILHKPGTLTKEEQALMRRHVEYAFQLLEDYAKHGGRERVRIIAIQHHEFQPDAYRRAKLGRRSRQVDVDRRSVNSVTLSAQLLALADKVDALLHARSYKLGFSRATISGILYRQFIGDRDLVHFVLRRLSPPDR